MLKVQGSKTIKVSAFYSFVHWARPWLGLELGLGLGLRQTLHDIYWWVQDLAISLLLYFGALF